MKKTFLVFLLLFPSLLLASKHKSDFSEKNDSFKVSKRNLEKLKKIPLNGSWVFYPNNFISPVNFRDDNIRTNIKPIHIFSDKKKLFNPSFGTYTFSIETEKGNPFYLHTTKFFSASQWFYLDGKKVTNLTKNGVISHSPTLETPGYKPSVIKINPLTNKGLLIIHSSSHHFKDSFVDYLPFITKKNYQSIDVILKSFFLGVFGLFFLLSLVLFLITKKKVYIFISLFSFSTLLWSLLEGHIIWNFFEGSKIN